MTALRIPAGPGLLLTLCLTLLAGCAAGPGQDPGLREWSQRRILLEELQAWSFSGRIAVRQADESQTARIDWEQNGDQYLIRVWGTLSAGYTEIHGGPDEVRLEQRGEEPLIARSPEALVYDQLGYELPVSELRYWVRGIPAPGSETQLSLNESQQLDQLLQQGWRIRYMGYRQFGNLTLPDRIRLERDELRLDLVRLTWEPVRPEEST